MFADVTSQNIVGYNKKDTVQQNNFLAAPFNTIGCNTIDIQDIKITNGEVGWESEFFSIWEGAPSHVDGTEYTYWDSSYDPDMEATECYWGDDDWNKAIFSIPEGQSFVIECAEDLKVQASGSVPENEVTFTTVQQNNFIANPFPTEIDIQDIKLTGGEVGWESEFFSIWEGAPSHVVGAEFTYWDSSYDPDMEATECYWGDDEWNKVSYPISAGQGFVIECAEDLTVTIKPPYTLK